MEPGRLGAVCAGAGACGLRAELDFARKGTQRAALLVRDNLRHRSDIEDAYLDAIHGAREEIVIANAYFFPGSAFPPGAASPRRARGVRVVLLLQGRVEYVLLHYASRALYGTLLDAGVEIHEYHKSFLHAKVAVIDGQLGTVGSSNIDPFSLMLAREANVVVLDRKFAAELREALQQALEIGARVVQKMRWSRKPAVAADRDLAGVCPGAFPDGRLRLRRPAVDTYASSVRKPAKNPGLFMSPDFGKLQRRNLPKSGDR